MNESFRRHSDESNDWTKEIVHICDLIRSFVVDLTTQFLRKYITESDQKYCPCLRKNCEQNKNPVQSC